MNTKICKACGTENEGYYPFCKNCGAALINEDAASTPPADSFAETDFAMCGGISRREFQIYVGPNEHRILTQFDKMQATGQKTTWCWPAAVLGFLLGPAGASLWFFYRKIYKAAWILFALGMALTALAVWDFSTVLQGGDLNTAYDSLMNNVSAGREWVASVRELCSVVCGVLCGLFGFYWYRESAARRITAFRLRNTDPAYQSIGLMAAGGRSGGMLAVGIGLSYVLPILLLALTFSWFTVVG